MLEIPVTKTQESPLRSPSIKPAISSREIEISVKFTIQIEPQHQAWM
jgi:hypothetical protein